jgi:hypothetical protein
MINLVDWDAHLAAIRKLGFGEKRFITKFNFHWLPTGHQQHKVDSSQSTLCPSCQDPSIDETETHLYQCPQRIHLVGKLFNQLEQFHETEHTCPALQNTLKEALKCEIFGQPPGVHLTPRSPRTHPLMPGPDETRLGPTFPGPFFLQVGHNPTKFPPNPHGGPPLFHQGPIGPQVDLPNLEVQSLTLGRSQSRPTRAYTTPEPSYPPQPPSINGPRPIRLRNTHARSGQRHF